MGLSGQKPQLKREPAYPSIHSSLLTATAFSLSLHHNPFEVFILLQSLYQLCMRLKQRRKKLLLHCQLNGQLISIMMRLVRVGRVSTLPLLVLRESRPFSTGRNPFNLGKDKLLRGLASSVEFLMMRQKLGKKRRTKRTGITLPFFFKS